MNPLRNNLEIWFGSHINIGLPAYAFISVLPLITTHVDSYRKRKQFEREMEERKNIKNQTLYLNSEKAEQMDDAKKKKQLSVFSITTLDILCNIGFNTGLSTLLNSISSSSPFVQAWAFQNNFNGRARGYFFKNLLEKFFIPRSISNYFFASDPSEKELNILKVGGSDDGSSSPFTHFFLAHLQRNLIDSIARATSISIGLVLLHVPSVRRILRPPEAMLVEQPHMLAQFANMEGSSAEMLAKQQQQEADSKKDESPAQKQHRMQIQMIEAMMTPNVPKTLDSLKWVWMGECKVLLVNAVICGLVRKLMNKKDKVATVEFWVGNYFTFVVEKVIDLIVLLSAK